VSQSGIRERVRALPLGVIGALALVILTERFVSRYDLEFSDVTALNWSFANRASKRVAPQTDVLCFGTSLVKFGVLPRSIENATGRSAYNLAACNAHMPTSYFLFKRALDSGARPRAVLVDCQDAPMLADHRNEQAEALRVNLRNWPELLTARKCVELAWTARDPNFLTTMLFSRMVPSYKSRFEIRKSVLGAIGGEYLTASGTTVVYLRNWNANRGANVMPRTLTAPPDDKPLPSAAKPAPDHFADGRWVHNQLTEIYARKFVELAAVHDIPVFWLIPPIPPRSVVVRRAEGLDRYFDDLARSAQAIYPRVTVIDGSRSNYAPDTFCDVAHLNAKGSIAFSESVGEVLSQALAQPDRQPRWITLPAYTPRDRPIDPGIEDVDGSRLAVKEGRVGKKQ
jgi:hypothetical protein